MPSQVEAPLQFLQHIEQCHSVGFTDNNLILQSYTAYISAYRDYVQYGQAGLSTGGSVRSDARDNNSVSSDSDASSGVSLQEQVTVREVVEEVMTPVTSQFPRISVAPECSWSRLETVPDIPAITESSYVASECATAIETVRKVVSGSTSAGTLCKAAVRNTITTLGGAVPWFLVGACQLPTVLARIACVPSPRKLAYRMQLAALYNYDAVCVNSTFYAGVVASQGSVCVGTLFASRSTVEEDHVRRWMESVGGKREAVQVYLEDQGMSIPAVAVVLQENMGATFDISGFIDSEFYSEYLRPMDEGAMELRRMVFRHGLKTPTLPVKDVYYSSDSDVPVRGISRSGKKGRKRAATVKRVKCLSGLSEESSDSEIYGVTVKADFVDGVLPVGRILSSVNATHRVRPSAELLYMIDVFNVTSKTHRIISESEARLGGAYLKDGIWYVRSGAVSVKDGVVPDPSYVKGKRPALHLEYCITLFNGVSYGLNKYIVADVVQRKSSRSLGLCEGGGYI